MHNYSTRIAFFCFGLLCLSALGYGEEQEVAKMALQPFLFARADTLPIENFEDATDPYLEGYIQALVDCHYTEYRVIVSVRAHKVYLSNLPKNDLFSSSIISFVGDIPGVQSVEIEENFTAAEEAARKIYTERPEVKGVWFPQSTVLFQPLIADPREPKYSISYRFGDRVIGNSVADVSLGDDFPVFRWRDVFSVHGDTQFSIQACAWAVFDYEDVPDTWNEETCELVNTDYFLGLVQTFAFEAWSFRLRLYHISSHLGDEFLTNNSHFLCERVNPSYEAIDFFTSYQITSGIRAYIGPGVVIHSDESFKLKPLYVEYGAELRHFGKKFYYHRLYGTPFLAVHIENWQQHKWDFDIFLKLGYEWSKLQGIGRKMRVFVGYHNGFSYEGQFFNERTSYGDIGLSWGF